MNRNSGNSDISFSLDPENNNINSPNHMKIYKPDILKGTHIGEDLFKADYLMKEMALGTKVIGLDPPKYQNLNFPNVLLAKGLNHIFTDPNVDINECGGRIWMDISE